jgi:hypothetical protein
MHFIIVAAATWVLGLTAVIVFPYATDSTSAGDDLTRNTVRLALAYYALAAGVMLLLQPSEWTGQGRGRLARICWTLAWAAYLVHLAMAFHFYHHWSHTDAIRHTREVSGFGEGIYVSHLFTLLWGVDVATWWLWPKAYATRRRWIGISLHAFMTFVIFNATVVYESGPIRWVAIFAYAGLATLVIYHRMSLPRAAQ